LDGGGSNCNGAGGGSSGGGGGGGRALPLNMVHPTETLEEGSQVLARCRHNKDSNGKQTELKSQTQQSEQTSRQTDTTMKR
jgi:hypothetical protein